MDDFEGRFVSARTAPVIRLASFDREGAVLRYRFDSTIDAFGRRDFFVEYAAEPDAPPGVLLMPFAAIMMPIAWAAGATLELPELDADFAESFAGAREYWEKCYPKWRFDEARLEATLTRNRFDVSRAGMLFSGGLDSLATYVHRRDEEPALFTVIGADFPCGKADFADLCKEKLFGRFAREEGANLEYIRTNASDVLDLKKLSRYATNWYGAVQHGLMLASLVAPASCRTLRRLYFASCSHKKDYRFPCGSAPEIVRRLRWASSSAWDDLEDVNRAGKIGLYLKPNPRYLTYLRTCWMQHEQMNCSRCEKCLRTICELLLNGIDPNAYNFRVDARTLERLKFRLTRRYYLFFRGNEGTINFWRAIQDSIDLRSIEDKYGSRAFFEWLAGYGRLRKPQNKLLVSFWLSALDARDGAKRLLVRKDPAAA